MCRNEKSRDNLKIPGSTLVWSFILILVTASAVADVGGEEGTKRTAPNIIEKFEVEEDFGVKKALAMLGSQCQKNIVPSPGVNGSLAFRRLTNVTFEEAMEAILGDNALYEEQGNLIKVYTKEEYKKLKEDIERMIHKVFTLYYLKADEAEKLVKPVLSSSGKLSLSSPSVEGVSTGKSGVGGETGGNSMALHDTIVIYDFPEKVAKAEDILKALDVRPQQVMIEATILSATLTEGMELGIDWNLLGGVSLDGTPSTQDYVSGDTVDRGTEATKPITQISVGDFAGTAMESFGFAKLATGGLRIGITSGNLAGFINALETVTDITVLANPKILALNKQSGTVFIGQKIGYRDRTTISDTGQATVGEVKFLDTGTKLSFRPFIGNDGYIRMEIYPKDSTGERDNEGIPQETTAELTTNIIVKDGETIVIGGLFRDAITTTRSQIPLLGDIPLIGALFRGTTDRNVRQEVIVILTPHIIETAGQTDGAARTDDVQRKRFGAKDELQQIGRARLAEEHYAEAVRNYDAGQIEAALKEVKSALELRPTYLEALRLRERIIAEKDGRQALDQLERRMSESMDRREAPSWLRR